MNIFTTDLTEREAETLELITKGYSNTQIMNELKIEYTTVKTHIANIYQKFTGNLSDDTTEHSVMRLRLALEYLKSKGMLDPVGNEKYLKALQKIKTLSKAINDSDDLLLWKVYQINKQILDTVSEALNEEA